MAKETRSTSRSEPKRDVSGSVDSDHVGVAPGGSEFLAVRETIESVVVAFALAFLIRTFEAEAFVIPTGSMSPSLLGQHKDVTCSQCGCRFRVTASNEDPEEARRRGIQDIRQWQTMAGVCPMCRFLMPVRPDLPPDALADTGLKAGEIDSWRTYPGDRILVNKFGSDFAEPERWDVIVFKFPGDGYMNYIKRLVGLPGERLRVEHGDLFRRPLDEREADFKIERKPLDKVAAMLQPVHDTDYEAATLFKAGWPLRWAATTPDGWSVDAKAGALTVQQQYRVEAGEETAWLRYRNILPEPVDWRIAVEHSRSRDWKKVAVATQVSQEEWLTHVRPELITDFNPYNSRIERGQLTAGIDWDIFSFPRTTFWTRLGANWVGDLAVECDLKSVEGRGQLVLDLVESGVHFQATFDLSKDEVTLGAVDGRTGQPLKLAGKGKAVLPEGAFQLRFANVDDRLALWIDGKPVELQGADYDPDELLSEGRAKMIPWKGAEGEDQGDLSPVGVGARDAKVVVSRLAVMRDIYYIATDHHHDVRTIAYDYDPPMLENPRDLFADSSHWPLFLTRGRVEFDVAKDQLFVMGDNSPESKDCRLWTAGDSLSGWPGGAYLDRKLLIGKAICVFWPHSWGAVPGLPFMPGWPNFGDVRFVR